MKLSISALTISLLMTIGMAAPIPKMTSRQLQGGSLPEAIQNAGGLSHILDGANLPLLGKGGLGQ
ncbi:hypothetical protein BJY04DRAFT_203514 [Aspergillus karnatakaensis]|uniref:uncharacterized protein n=1 Tax=Aspergillus karnatakaensis TaxID=1810916 RepID=UPI003CCD9A8C